MEYEVETSSTTLVLSSYTEGDRIIETWKYWLDTSDYPWPDSFNTAIASDVEELTHLNNTYLAWKVALNAKPK